MSLPRVVGLLAAVCALSLASALPAVAADHDPHACDEARNARSAASLNPATPLAELKLLDEAAVRVCGHDGLHADVTVPDLTCVHVEALTSRALADARVRVPCAPRWDGFTDCEQARAAGVHDIPQRDERYRGVLDRDHDGVACESSGGDDEPSGVLPVASSPEIIVHDLPVTG